MRGVKADLIPHNEGAYWALPLYETILRYFEDPEHQAEFEKWLQEGGEKSEGLQVIDGGGGSDHSSGSSSSGGK